MKDIRDNGGMEDLRDVKLNSAFPFHGRKLECRKCTWDAGCNQCFFSFFPVKMADFPDQCAGLKYCVSAKRKDRTSVYYKLL